MSKIIIRMPNLATRDVELWDETEVCPRQIPVKTRTKKGWKTIYMDVRDAKIGQNIDGGTVIENTFL